MKKIVLYILTLVLVLSVDLSVFATETDTSTMLDYSYENSYEVVVNVPEKKNFTPEDFPEVSCSDVVAASLKKTESGYQYTLIIIYEERVNIATEKVKIKENAMVFSVADNEYITGFGGMVLSDTKIYLKTGEQKDITVKSVELQPMVPRYTGLFITLDPGVYRIDGITKDLFGECGLREFMTLTKAKEEGLVEDIFYTENEHYFGLIDDGFGKKQKYVKVIDALAKIGGVEEVFLYEMNIPSEEIPKETWGIVDNTVGSISVRGGELANEEFEDSYINQIGTVEGLKQGTTTLRVRRTQLASQATAECQVVVYIPGDVNFDGETDANDSLAILKYVAKMPVYDFDEIAADKNEDGMIDANDALSVLKTLCRLE